MPALSRMKIMLAEARRLEPNGHNYFTATPHHSVPTPFMVINRTGANLSPTLQAKILSDGRAGGFMRRLIKAKNGQASHYEIVVMGKDRKGLKFLR